MRTETVRRYVEPHITENDETVELTLTIKVNKGSGMVRVAGKPCGTADTTGWFDASMMTVQVLCLLDERYRKAS